MGHSEIYDEPQLSLDSILKRILDYVNNNNTGIVWVYIKCPDYDEQFILNGEHFGKLLLVTGYNNGLNTTTYTLPVLSKAISLYSNLIKENLENMEYLDDFIENLPYIQEFNEQEEPRVWQLSTTTNFRIKISL